MNDIRNDRKNDPDGYRNRYFDGYGRNQVDKATTVWVHFTVYFEKNIEHTCATKRESTPSSTATCTTASN